jgi:type IV pilus assembly protein PilZ
MGVKMAEADDERSALPDTEPTHQAKKKVLSLTIRDKSVLYAAYMPFLKHGGLFIPTKKYFAMGEEVSLIITLLDSENRHNVSGKVVWITPMDSQSNKAGGIGIEFVDDHAGEQVRKRIEEMLGPLLQSSDATHTM